MSPTPSSVTLVSGENLYKRFGAITAVDHMYIDVQAGEIHGLVGENGAGKSTLIAMLGGSLGPDGGHIECDGRRFSSLTPVVARRLGINIVYQELSLAPNLTVGENIFLGRPPTKWGVLTDRRAILDGASEALERLGASIDPTIPVDKASHADRQLTEIARAVVGRVRVLILDEPTSSLTHHDFDRLKDTLRKLTASGVGVVFVSHRLPEVLELAGRITVMRDGRKVSTIHSSTTSARELASLMVGRDIERSSRFGVSIISAPIYGRTVLETRNASRAPSFTEVSITVRAGEIVGLAGLRGSGRHELVDSIYGLERLDSGEIWVDGERLRSGSPRDSRKRGVTYVPLNRRTQGLVSIWDVSRNLALGNADKTFHWGLMRSNWLKRWVRELLNSFAITPSRPETSIQHLSGGNQQKVVLARNIVGSPKLLLLLEPTRGVDVGSKEEIRAIVRDISRRGAGVLLVDSELSELVSLCNRVYVMHRGRVVQELSEALISEESVTFLAAGGQRVG